MHPPTSRPAGDKEAVTSKNKRTVYRNEFSKLASLLLSLLGLILGGQTASAQEVTTLIQFTNVWKYNDAGLELGIAWRTNDYDDSAWPSGLGLLGYEPDTPAIYTIHAPINTPLTISSTTRTFYFRATFNFIGPTNGLTLIATNLVDDGCAIYINGGPVGSVRAPASWNATTFFTGGTEGTLEVVTFTNLASLRQGSNLVAVEVHQSGAISSDIMWGMKLVSVQEAAPPTIAVQPQSQTVLAGTEVTFDVSAGGTPPLVYQWQFNGADLLGATNASLVIANAQNFNAGNYLVVAVNSFGAVTSAVAVLAVETGVAQAPNFSWANNGGGSVFVDGRPGLDAGWSVTSDSAGNSYVAGLFCGSANFGGIALTGTCPSGFLVKYSATGTVLWAKSLTGAPGGAAGYSVTADYSGNVFVTGTTAKYPGIGSAFVAKYDDSGALAWFRVFATQTPGFSCYEAAGTTIAAAPDGGAYVAGRFCGTSVFGTNVLTSAGFSDVFLARLDAAGNVTWVKGFGGPGDDEGLGVVVNSQGTVFFGGSYYSGIAFGYIVLTNCCFNTDFFIAKCDQFGNCLWARQISGFTPFPFLVKPTFALATDHLGNAYVTGGVDFQGSGFISKYDATGSLVWTRSMSASPASVSCDRTGNVYFGGTFSDSIALDGITLSQANTYDAFVFKLNPSGIATWATRVRGTYDNFCHAITSDPAENILMAGYFLEPASFDTITLTGPEYEAFVAKLGTNAIPFQPAIYAQPQSQSVSLNGTATLGVLASGGIPLRFQWQFNGLDLAGQTNSGLTISNAGAAYEGSYRVVVSNIFGSTTSVVATLSVLRQPSIIRQPENQIVTPGSAAEFNVNAGGTAPLSFQWTFDGAGVPGATNSSLILPSVQSADAGRYGVIITNSYGAVTSKPASLVVTPTGSPVISWGNYFENQPRVPVGLMDAIAIAVGPQDSLALKSDGLPVSWSHTGSPLPVPATAHGAIAIARGGGHALALKPDGTLAAWGDNSHGQQNIPAGVTNVTAIAAGSVHSLALKTDGTVIGWGKNISSDFGESDVPVGLTNVVAIAAGLWHSLALKADGTVIGWGFNIYGQARAPSNLTNAIAIAGGQTHSLALTREGKVVGWGINDCGQLNTPAGLTNIVAITAGACHSIALKSDGTIVVWGSNTYGQLNIPPELVNGIAIAAREQNSLALVGDGSPAINVQPYGRTLQSGRDTTLTVLAVGTPPLFRQWRFNGTNISGATNTTLFLTNVQSVDAGRYSMVLSNAKSVSVSASAELQIVESAPFITTQPRNQLAIAGTDAVLTATAAGTLPLSYQWRLNGTNLPGAIEPALMISNVQLPSDGAYTLFVTNNYGAVTSSVAHLSVRFTLTALTNGSGSTTPSPALIGYPPNSVVALYATPEIGFVFVNWSGDASGTTNPVSVIMTTNKIVAANFAPTITTGVQGQGSVNRAPNKPFYSVGEQVTLTATPGRWHAFTGWDDGIAANPRAITIGANNNYTAIFSPTTALETLSFSNVTRIAPTGMPVILVDGQFVTNDAVTRLSSAQIEMLTSFPNGTVLYTLDGSEPSLFSTLYFEPITVRRTITIRAKAWSANFVNSWGADPVTVIIEPAYSLSASTAGGGRITVSPASESYSSNTVVRFGATPSPGWKFLQWLGDAGGTNIQSSVVMTRSKCVEAVFGTALNLTTAGGGAVLAQPDTTLYPYGTVVWLTGVPEAGNAFALWGNAASGTNNPFLLLVTNTNLTVSAAFAPLNAGQYALTLLADGFGMVTNKPRSNRFNAGLSVTLTALPEAGQQFVGWSGDASGAQNPLTVVMNFSKVIKAHFTKRPVLALQPCSEPSLEDGFQFLLTGEFGAHYQLEKSDDSQDWVPLATVTNLFGTTQYNDETATNRTRRVYRAVLAP